MLWLVRWLVWAFFRGLLALRYRVWVVGKAEALKHPGPYLILPNHPAYCDPPNLIVRLFPVFKARPMALETNFQNPILGFIAWLINPIRVPDTDKNSADARDRAQAAVGSVIDALKAGENVILWPSGRLMRDGSEKLGGARTVADVLAAVPNVTVVTVRTRGLWGSMFSWARGTRPSLNRGLIRGIGILLSNLLVFAPRRKVTVTLEAFPASKRPEPVREKINPWLESWYNADARRETPTYVPYHFLFGPRSVEYPPPPVAAASFDISKVKADTRAAVNHMVETKLKRPLGADEGAAETTFMELGLDSLDTMDVALQVEQQYGFSSDTVPTTLGQLWALADGLLTTAPPRPTPPAWFAQQTGSLQPAILGDTIAAAFVHRVVANPKDVAAADDLAGVVTYEKMLVGAWAMAGRFKEIEAPNVGLMLPASVACDLGLFGLHLAGKLPVVLNWTTGPGNLAHAAKLMNLTHVVTSKAFIDRVQVEVAGVKYVFLEDVKASLGKLYLLRRLLAVRWFPTATAKKLLSDLNPDKHAPTVVLFTSGSEKAPKAVPLTHENLLSNLRGVIDVEQLTRNDSVLGFLPMFHSFGMTVTGLLPILAGGKVVHHPDPTDSAALVRKTAGYKPTLAGGTPTFMGYIFDRAKPGDLDSFRLIVVGAERCPDAVFEKAKTLAKNAVLIEGYGITECSPIIAAHWPGKLKRGTLGHPFPDIEVCAVDLETDAVLPPGEMGMLHVSGPNVFPGYIGHDGPSPFREMNGKRWYVTGDLGTLDADGQVVFSGRLKRFLKAGGEMISLPALEEPFTKLYPPTDKGPRVAVEGIETETGRRIVLFTTEEMGLRDANAVLQKEGFRGVMRLDDVQTVDAIPVLGTGKTDYKVLRARITG